MILYFYAFLIALSIAYLVTPLVKKLAWKIGAVDIPDDSRRIHIEPIPRAGGLAIYLSFLATVLITVPLDESIKGVILGSTLIIVLGIFDDIYDIPAKYKLLGQIVAAGVLIHYGIRIEWVTNPFGNMFYLGRLSIPITIFWVVGVTNTLNFIDGLDGLAAGVSSIASFTLLFVALKEGLGSVAILTAVLAGGALGFLPHNFNPAKIFMGDTGAMFLGYVLGAVSIMGTIKSATAIALAVPILALGLPIFDTAFAICRRAANGCPVMKADKDHLHHRLLAIGLSQKQTVLIMYSISGILGMVVIVLMEMGFFMAGLLLISFLTFLAILGRQLGLTDLKHPDKGI